MKSNLPIRIAPSLLAADFGKINEEIKTVEEATDCIHLDVMDGHFVPNISFGAPVISCLKTKIKKCCHLMIQHPEKYLADFIEAGADIITVHASATANLRDLLHRIKNAGVEAGVALNPGTPVEEIEHVLDLVDVVVVMTVEPGFGGQAFMPEMLPKIEKIRSLSDTTNIAVDGGISAVTAPACARAGANIFVAGSAIFGAADRGEAITNLHKAIANA